MCGWADIYIYGVLEVGVGALLEEALEDVSVAPRHGEPHRTVSMPVGLVDVYTHTHTTRSHAHMSLSSLDDDDNDDELPTWPTTTIM
jgi:hypothetical protein